LYFLSEEQRFEQRRVGKESELSADSRILSGTPPVTSSSPYRLSVSPDSRLSGSPGKIVNVEFFLENVSGRSAYFLINVQETQVILFVKISHVTLCEVFKLSQLALKAR
jgi:hypothetical protein